MTTTTPVRAQICKGVIRVPEAVVAGHENYYAHRVKGDSMTGDHIYEGDYVLVDPDIEPADGDIVAVFVTNWRHTQTGDLCQGRMLKRLRCNGTVLESSNPAYAPMTLKPEHHAVIEGVVFASVRYFDGEPE